MKRESPDGPQSIDGPGSPEGVRPVRDGSDSPGYPSLADASRRGFLQWATAGAAAGVVTGVGESEARARALARHAKPVRPARPAKPVEEKVTVSLPWGLRLGGGSLRAERLIVWTRDKRFARFLKNGLERSGIQQAVSKLVNKAPVDTAFDGRKIYRLEQQVARAVARWYRKRTGHRTGRVDLMIHLGRRYRIRTSGIMIRPHRPIRPVIRKP